MLKNFMYCSAGILVGFLVGFLVANTVSQPAAPSQTANTPAATRAPVGPLDPSEMDGELPPNHPDIGQPANGEGGTPASTSAEAQEAMDEADRDARDFDAQMKAAETFYGLRDFEKAELYLSRALDLKPEDVKAHVLMGNSKYDRKDFDGAAAFYERALAIDPNDPNVRTDFGNTFFLREPPDLQRAISEYRKSLAVEPRHEQSWLNLASASIRLKDKATAIEALARLEAVNPQNPSLPSLRQGAEALE